MSRKTHKELAVDKAANHAASRRPLSAEGKKRLSEHQKHLWLNPQYRDKVTRAIRAGIAAKRSRAEIAAATPPSQQDTQL
jgi:hypothetical protein